MYKFKTSKYKNAIAKLSKKEEWITDITVSSSFSYGSLIKASASFVFFVDDESGNGSLNVLPLEFKGKKPRHFPRLQCHAEPILDFDVSPFDDGIVATGSQDCSVKLWHVSREGLKSDLSNPAITLPWHKNRVENVLFHPTVDCVLTVSDHNNLTLWDCVNQSSLFSSSDAGDTIQSISWNANGSLLASTCKDKIIRIVDPRSNSSAQEVPGHGCPKDSRVVWLGDSDNILTTGFEMNRQREACLRDVRNPVRPLKTVLFDTSTGILLPYYDPDTKMLFIAGKADASITFLEISDSDPYVVEASRFITDAPTRDACLLPKRALNVMQAEVNRLLQLTPSAVVPITYQVPRKSYRDFHHDLFPDTEEAEPALTLSEWVSGTTKKRTKFSLDPSKCNSTSLRKHRTSFSHNTMAKKTTSTEDLSADEDVFMTNEEIVNLQAKDTSLKSTNKILRNDSLNDDKEHLESDMRNKSPLIKAHIGYEADKNSKLKKPIPLPKPAISPQLMKKHSYDSLATGDLIKDDPSPSPLPKNKHKDENYQVQEKNRNIGDLNKRDVLKDSNHGEEKKDEAKETFAHEMDIFKKPPKSLIKESQVFTKVNLSQETPPKKDVSSPKPFTGFRTSKFRHLKGTPLHRSQHIENLRNLNTSLPGECDGIHTNRLRVALPLKGPGGRITILELSKPGRLPDGVLPVLQNGTNVMDFCWDPFDDQKLAVGCDDGSIRIWVIPETGLAISQETPSQILKGHSEKIYFIKYHPLAKDIITSASYDFTVRIWDLTTSEEKYCLTGHTEQIFNLAWSPDGKYLATISKDSKIRIYNPRMSSTPILEGPGPVGSRGARIIWVLQGRYLVASGFDKVSERLISLYNVENCKEVATIRIDVSPAILIPYYDEDSNTLFLTGKGDSTIYAYEVLEEQPYFFPLSHHKCPNVHQGLTFFPKIVCNIRAVEFARALRLVGFVLEPLSFTVPRVKMDFFQDDLFPDTKVLWEPTLTSSEWLSGMNKNARRISLLPKGMPLLSSSNPKLTVATKSVSEGTLADKTTKEKEAQLAKSISSRINVEKTLPQDSMQGVDPSEWDED